MNRILRYKATATCLRDEDIFVNWSASSPHLGTAVRPYLTVAQVAAYPPVFPGTRIVIEAGSYQERSLRLHTPMVLTARNGSVRLGR